MKVGGPGRQNKTREAKREDKMKFQAKQQVRW